MRFEGGFAVGVAGELGEEGVDTVGPVVTTASVPCVEFLEKGIGLARVVLAAGASTEPVPTSVDTAKTIAKMVSAAGITRPRPEQRSPGATEAETRAMKLPEGAEMSSILIRDPCVRQSRKSAEV